MERYAPDADYRDPDATAAWAILELFRKAVGGIEGEVTKESVVEAYASIENETLGGLMPQPMTFSKDKPAPEVNCFWMFRYEAGDENPTTIPPLGPSGNGEQGDLASQCYPVT
ncbi:hypothetical protein [Pseudonocardia thermophila]|uniref:hypothetical protein n=1 Tax=Pseudonocardia thermophila TaxID=1848 RepID=UPI00248D9D51|nr:hypothetical protein [Pseudonocardia thermophila]